jgi:hypothetical protein
MVTGKTTGWDQFSAKVDEITNVANTKELDRVLSISSVYDANLRDKEGLIRYDRLTDAAFRKKMASEIGDLFRKRAATSYSVNMASLPWYKQLDLEFAANGITSDQVGSLMEREGPKFTIGAVAGMSQELKKQTYEFYMPTAKMLLSESDIPTALQQMGILKTANGYLDPKKVTLDDVVNYGFAFKTQGQVPFEMYTKNNKAYTSTVTPKP